MHQSCRWLSCWRAPICAIALGGVTKVHSCSGYAIQPAIPGAMLGLWLQTNEASSSRQAMLTRMAAITTLAAAATSAEAMKAATAKRQRWLQTGGRRASSRRSATFAESDAAPLLRWMTEPADAAVPLSAPRGCQCKHAYREFRPGGSLHTRLQARGGDAVRTATITSLSSDQAVRAGGTCSKCPRRWLTIKVSMTEVLRLTQVV